ncbi:AcvB/VirJ family lysyl-phosphatidylglycerol hydrolase [Pedobacter gandavensis]|uniref:AcvB/VirJ family lysyl-phosphatidylglycerol hydrolase n=1 Tax=Pedobacter gandavensis TaxID=2679963 RepID=UPI002930E54D|nr:AcvB/VirJ family lysyl-phosphatidylglycerol hydrolase [Pedobacter gandavensis]
MRVAMVFLVLLFLSGSAAPGANSVQPVLPLTLIAAPQQNNLPLIFMISGDGGWTRFDQSLSLELASKGFSVLGLDARKYFWKAKSPDEASKELNKALSRYLVVTGKNSLVMAGYSFGASVIPFIAVRLPADLKANLKAVIALSPDVRADFEVQLIYWLNFGKNKDQYQVIAAMKSMMPLIPVSIFGAAEGDKIKSKFAAEGMKVVTIPGDHHFDKDYEHLGKVFIKQIPD